MKLKIVALTLIAPTLIAMAVSGCSPFPGPHPPDEVASVKALTERSMYFEVPAEATDIKHRVYHFQDRNEFLHFRSDRTSAEAFARDQLGFAPTERGFRFQNWMVDGEALWWPRGEVANSRGGRATPEEEGRREVLIVDHAGGSEVWAFRASP